MTQADVAPEVRPPLGIDGSSAERLHAAFEQVELFGARPAVLQKTEAGITMSYDPRQMSAIEAREFLMARTAFTEGPEADAMVEAAQQHGGAFRDLVGEFLGRVDRFGDPVGTAQEFLRIFAAAQLYVFAEKRRLRIVRADGPNGHLLTEAMVVDGLLLVPPGRSPQDTLRDVGAADCAAAVR